MEICVKDFAFARRAAQISISNIVTFTHHLSYLIPVAVFAQVTEREVVLCSLGEVLFIIYPLVCGVFVLSTWQHRLLRVRGIDTMRAGRWMVFHPPKVVAVAHSEVLCFFGEVRSGLYPVWCGVLVLSTGQYRFVASERDRYHACVKVDGFHPPTVVAVAHSEILVVDSAEWLMPMVSRLYVFSLCQLCVTHVVGECSLEFTLCLR